MNADRLLTHFERISDAPDAVDRLRSLVLSLAYAGKLLPGVGTAAAKWKESTVGEVAAEIVPGIACSKSHQTPKGHVHLRTHNIATNGRLNFDLVIRVDPKKLAVEKSGLRRGDVIFNNTNSQELVGKTCLVDQDYEYAFSNHLTRIRLREQVAPEFFTGYFQLLLRKGFFAKLCNRWIGQAGINTTALKGIAFAFPALPEQQRIVAKVDELMKLCDQLEASQQERESRRDRLVVASLNRLSQPTDPDEFKKDARFQLSHLSRLSTKPEHIKELRKAILNLAVRGKLVPQDEREGVADAYATEPQHPALPKAWKVLTFGRHCDIEGGGQPPKTLFSDEPRPGYVRLYQIRDLGDKPVPTYIPEKVARSRCKEGDILIGRYGASVGKIFWARDGAYNVAMAKFIYPPDAFVPAFAFLLLRSYWFQAALANAARSAQAGFNKGDLKDITFPLPPLAEQKRIVAKVDELMLICDQLETQLESQQKGRRQLLEALLHEALEGVG